MTKSCPKGGSLDAWGQNIPNSKLPLGVRILFFLKIWWLGLSIPGFNAEILCTLVHHVDENQDIYGPGVDIGKFVMVGWG